MIGSATISLCSRKQNIVALSSCEVEYIAIVHRTSQTQWLEMMKKLSIQEK